MGLLSLGCSFRQLSPLKRSHGQQGVSTLGVCELGKPIAFRRFAQAIFRDSMSPSFWAMSPLCHIAQLRQSKS
jgi:hypothetical protein